MRAKRTAEAQLGLPEYSGHTLAEKIAFALLVLFVIGALLGLLGDGPLSQTVARSADGGVQVDYQRFCRRLAPESLDITFPVPPGADSMELTINGDYLRRVQITEIFPEPAESRLDQRSGKLRFSTDGSAGSMVVRLHLEPQHAGVLDARIAVGPPGKPVAVQFRQIVYP